MEKSISAINLECLYGEMEEQFNEKEAKDLDNQIKQCGLFKIDQESDLAFFLSENEEQIIEMFPKIQIIRDNLKNNMYFDTIIIDFEDLCERIYEAYNDYNIKYEIHFNDGNIIEEAKFYFDEEKIMNLWNSNDIYQEFLNAKKEIVKQITEEEIIELINDIDSENDINWNKIIEHIQSKLEDNN